MNISLIFWCNSDQWTITQAYHAWWWQVCVNMRFYWFWTICKTTIIWMWRMHTNQLTKVDICLQHNTSMPERSGHGFWLRLLLMQLKQNWLLEAELTLRESKQSQRATCLTCQLWLCLLQPAWSNAQRWLDCVACGNHLWPQLGACSCSITVNALAAIACEHS